MVANTQNTHSNSCIEKNVSYGTGLLSSALFFVEIEKGCYSLVRGPNHHHPRAEERYETPGGKMRRCSPRGGWPEKRRGRKSYTPARSSARPHSQQPMFGSAEFAPRFADIRTYAHAMYRGGLETTHGMA